MLLRVLISLLATRGSRTCATCAAISKSPPFVSKAALNSSEAVVRSSSSSCRWNVPETQGEWHCRSLPEAALSERSWDPETQRTLEMRHRLEEDDIYRQFANKRISAFRRHCTQLRARDNACALACRLLRVLEADDGIRSEAAACVWFQRKKLRTCLGRVVVCYGA
ncbi:hypothetical protein MTO96_004883 [Rhipicephalus appendiculatus]